MSSYFLGRFPKFCINQVLHAVCDTLRVVHLKDGIDDIILPVNGVLVLCYQLSVLDTERGSAVNCRRYRRLIIFFIADSNFINQ